MHRTGAALPEAAPETRTVQAEIVSQEIQKGHRRIIYRRDDGSAIHIELILRHSDPLTAPGSNETTSSVLPGVVGLIQ
jgi:hypothetical protein